MFKSKTIKDIFRVSLSNIIVLFSGILVGFLLPKVIGVEDYGYYKTYTLYATYVGMFHFGITDGIYLKFGGKDYSVLNREKFRYYCRAFYLIEFIMAAFLFLGALVFFKDDMRYIFVFLSLYLLFHNITGYYQGISQATSRFGELSTRNIIQSVLISVAVICMWIMERALHQSVNYRTYIVLYTFIIFALTVWYITTYKEITFGEAGKADFREILSFIKLGFPLMLANLCSSLILTLDRQFVNVLFDTSTYAIYAFAYNMLALVTTATSAISMVIYPKLKQTDEKTLKDQYSTLIMIILCLVYGCLTVFYPPSIFVNWYLPKYIGSLVIFRIIFPGLAISSAITIVMHNYYKALGINGRFFSKSIISLIVSGVANAIAYMTFRSTQAISIASIITMIFWYFLVEFYFIKQYRIKWTKNFTYMIAMMLGFYAVTCIRNLYIGFVVYILVFVVLSFGFFGNQLKTMLKKD